MLPGNGLRDNWYLGRDPILVRDVGEFKSRCCDLLAATYKLQDPAGNSITVRMGDEGVLIVESATTVNHVQHPKRSYGR